MIFGCFKLGLGDKSAKSINSSFFLFNLLRRRSLRAPVVHSGLRPPCIDFPHRNKHNMQRAKSSFL